MHASEFNEAAIAALAAAERQQWFVRDQLVNAALRYAENNRERGIDLLQSAIAELTSGSQSPTAQA